MTAMPLTARSPAQICDFFRDKITANRQYPGRPSLPSGQRGALIGMMNRYFGGDDNRKRAISWLLANISIEQPGSAVELRIISSKAYDDAIWFAIADWVGAYVDDDQGGVWTPQPTFPVEAMLVSLEARKYKPVEPPDILDTVDDGLHPAVRVAVLDGTGETTEVREIPAKVRRFSPPPPPNFEE